jgi:membrane protein
VSPEAVRPTPEQSTDRDALRRAKGGEKGRRRGVRGVIDLAMATYEGYKKDQGLVLSAAISYYALFAMGPLVLLTITIAGLVIGTQAASGSLSETLERYLGPELAGMVLSAITGGLGAQYATTFTAVGAGFLLYGSARLFLRLQQGANLMWGVRASGRSEPRKLIVSRLFLLVATIVPALLMVASFLFSSVISWLGGPYDAPMSWVIGVVQRVTPAAVVWMAVMVLFMMLPDVRLSLRDVWLGSLFTAIGLIIGTDLFGIYLNWDGSSSFYGAAGAILALLVWTHYMAIIIVVGMRFTRVLYERAGKQIRPASYAVQVHEVAVPGQPGAGSAGD